MQKGEKEKKEKNIWTHEGPSMKKRKKM